jgi:hypothetical protein
MSETDPDLSIILVNWNGAALLPRCLQSLVRATQGIRSELILVDNGSTDRSLEIARGICPAAAAIELDRNTGYAAGNNAGLRRSRGRYLLLLNTDTEMPAVTLRAMLDVMCRDERLGILGCRQHDRLGDELLSRHEAFDGPLAPSFRASTASDAAWVSGACLLARREMYQQIGGLDEAFPLYYEDVDWCYRARLAGWKVEWLGEVSITHDAGGSSGGIGRTARRKLQLRSESLFYAKHAGPTAHAAWLAQRIARSTANVVWSAVGAVVCPTRRRREKLGLHVSESAAYFSAAWLALRPSRVENPRQSL